MKRIAEATISIALIVIPAALYLSGLPGLGAAGAVAFLFVAPGLLATLAATRLVQSPATAAAWSLLVNSLALVLVFLLLRSTVDVSRFWFVGAWVAWTTLLAVVAWRRGGIIEPLGHLCKRYGPGLLAGGIVMAATAGVLFPEQFQQCFCEDGTESLELARSLKHHFLPYWELETGDRLGTVVVNPSLVNSYWTCALQLLLGENELATRLPYWVWWSAIFAVLYRMLVSAGNGWPSALALGLSVSLVTVLHTFYVGYNPYMADLANNGVPDALFTLFLILALDCLKHKDRWGFALSMLSASLVLYSGPIFMALILASAWLWQPIRRSDVFRWANTCAGLLLLVLAFYLFWGWREGSLSCWVDTIDIEYINDYLAPVPRWKSGLLFLGYFVIACGGITVLGLVTAFWHDRWQRTVATATLLYLAIALCSGFKNLHYFGPIMPLPLLLFLSVGQRRKTLVWRRSALAACSLIVCIVLCRPAQRQTFTLNRRLGTNTLIVTDSYLTALEWAKIRFELRQAGSLSWDCDQSTWVAYATRDATPQHFLPLVLTDGDPPTPDYQLVGSRPLDGTDTTVRLYARDKQWVQWLRSPPPLGPRDRYPLVFRPLAGGVFSPHENTLEDVRRLHWPW